MAEQIGEYNRKIEIWQRTGDKDAAGEPIIGAWTLYKTLWAKIRGRTGLGWIREIGAVNGKEVNSALDLSSVRVAYRTDITPDMQLRMGGKTYEIMITRPDIADREFTDIVIRVGGGGG